MLDPEELARRFNVSMEAAHLVRDSEVIDLHVDTFIARRLWAYDIFRHHGAGPLRGFLFGHLDVPRMVEGGLTGAMWSITTNPVRSARGRWATLQRNLEAMKRLFEASEGQLRLARNLSEYQQARQAGAIACMPVIQGGHALQAAPQGVQSIPEQMVVRVTLVHLTSSVYGATSSPGSLFQKDRGLTDAGRDLVRQLNAARVFVDLAHLHPNGFWHAVEVHDRSQPLIVTHTGVRGVLDHWRNLDDAQIRAIAETGGTIGILFHTGFLKRPGGPGDGRMIVEHMQHVIDVVGDDFVSIGSDYDGSIIPPRDMRHDAAYPRLVQYMLDRGWSGQRIQKVLGQNYLRVLGQLRP